MGLGSLLKSVLRPSEAKTEEPSAEKAGAAQEDARPPLTAFNPEMPVDILADFNTLLLSGRLASFGQESLTVERVAGEMSLPVQQAGAAVFVRGYNAQMEPAILRGVIAKSSLIECVVDHLEPVPYDNQRKSVRYPLSPPASIYVMDDTWLDKPQQCQLLNISTGGACISSTFRYELGQTLRLEVELLKSSGGTTYHCQVVRMTKHENDLFEYGLLFAQLDRRTMNELKRDIAAIQEATKKRLMS